MKLVSPTLFRKHAVVCAVLATFSLTSLTEATAASNEDWHYADSIQTGGYVSAEKVLYLSNNPAALNDQDSSLSFTEYQNAHPDLSPERIYGLIQYRAENDIDSVSNNNLTLDLKNADLSNIELIEGIYVNGTSTKNVSTSNSITIKNSISESSKPIILMGISVAPSDCTRYPSGEIKQDFESNTLNIEGGVYSSIRGFKIAGGKFKDNSIHVQGVLISTESNYGEAFIGMESEYFDGQFENNHITFNNIRTTGLGSIRGIDLITNSVPTEEQSFYSDNSMSIEDSTIEGDVALISGYLTHGSQEEIDQYIETTSNNSNILSINNSEISGYVSVYSYRTNLSEELFEYIPVANHGTLKASGVNKVGALAGYAQLVLQVDETNTSSRNAVITVTGNTATEQKNKNILVNDSANPNAVYYLLATSENSNLRFTNLEIGKEATFYQTNQTISELNIESDQVMSWKNGKVSVIDISEEEVPEPSPEPDVPVEEDPVVTPTDNSKTLSESLLGTVAFLNQGAEFIADEAMAAMVNSAELGEVSTFGAVHGGSSHYKTDSRVDVDGYTLAAGASMKINPNWILAGFIEAGWADSDSHVRGTKGKGDHDYYGVGLATRYNFNNAWYMDGSFRLGRASTDFSGSYATDSAKYNSDALYVTAHAGSGYILNLSETVDLDIYGRYLVTYLDSDRVRLHNMYSDKLEMDSTVTHAVRLGSRITGSFCSYADWKVGLAYEHVFDGDAESTVNSLNLEVPSLEGNTGIMEVGVSMKPSLNSPWSLNLGAKGYVGDREGVSGNMLIRYAF